MNEAAALKPALFIVEGTRVTETDPTTEPQVHEAGEQVVKAEPGLVIPLASKVSRTDIFRCFQV